MLRVQSLNSISGSGPYKLLSILHLSFLLSFDIYSQCPFSLVSRVAFVAVHLVPSFSSFLALRVNLSLFNINDHVLSLLSDVSFLGHSQRFYDRALSEGEFGMRLELDEGGLRSCSGKGAPIPLSWFGY